MEKKSSLLFMINNLEGGGAEKALVTLLSCLDKQKYDITLFLIFYNGVFLKDIPKEIKIKYLFKNKKSEFQMKLIKKVIKYLPPKFLYKYLIKESFDVEIAFLEGITTKIIGGSHQNSKKIAWVHTNLKKHNWVAGLYKNNNEMEKNYNQFNEIVFVSKNSLVAFNELFNVKASCSIISNPIDIKEIEIKSKDLIEGKNIFTFCTVGRLSFEKGYDRLISAHSKLVKEGLFHKIIIIGEGKERENLEGLIESLDIKETFELKGFQNNPYKFMRISDVFINTSRVEGLPLVIGEAILLGLPVICTNCGGPSEILDNGKFGLLVENSTEGIYEGMKKVLVDNSSLLSLRNASESRKEFFNVHHIIKQLENLFTK